MTTVDLSVSLLHPRVSTVITSPVGGQRQVLIGANPICDLRVPTPKASDYEPGECLSPRLTPWGHSWGQTPPNITGSSRTLSRKDWLCSWDFAW